MGIIAYYDQIPELAQPLQPVIPTQELREKVVAPVLRDTRVITLAEFDPVSKNTITAHRLKDYRRKTYSLSLLPDVELWLDFILEGSVFWNEKLHNESPYS